jgi:hypothetical protein
MTAADTCAGPWTCFHCSETFTTEADARLHFGLDEDSRPACIVKGTDGGLLRAYREAESDALEAWGIIHSESADALKAWRAAEGRHAQLVTAAEQAGYDKGVADQAAGIARLRRIVARYGDRVMMANCHRPDWQIEIDEALRFAVDNPEDSPT